jgi:molecular chaperone DnaJ
MKNYYEILGLSEGASQEEIRKAYLKLAQEWHPDKHQKGDIAGAEEKFKDISEAYENLKKGIATSEEGGSVHFNRNNMDDMMRDFASRMGFGFNMRNVDPYEEIQFPVTLKNIYNREEVDVSFTVYDQNDIKICGVCNGSGRIVQSFSSNGMNIHRTTHCHSCGGQGNETIGTGKTKSVKVKVDSTIKSLGKVGSYNIQARSYNEMRVRFTLQKDPNYTLVENGRGLMTTFYIEYKDLKTGITTDVDILGNKVKITIPPKPSLQRMITVPNKGMPIGKNARVNLYIKLDISYT